MSNQFLDELIRKIKAQQARKSGTKDCPSCGRTISANKESCKACSEPKG